MTRKEWEFTARFFKRRLGQFARGSIGWADMNETIHQYANECENQFANFNRGRFLEACGAQVSV